MDKELKYDPRYVKGFARLLTRSLNVETETLIDYRKCTDKDLDQFAEPTPDSESTFELYRKGERTLFCLDWEKHGDEIAIWGREKDFLKYQRFEFVLVPCNYVHPNSNDFISEECIEDRLAQEEYLGNLQMVFLSGEQTLNVNKFGEESI